MAGKKGRGGGGRPGQQAVPQATLGAVEAHHLTYMREEEKLARDVYLFLFDEWGMNVFRNIAAAEQKHMDALKTLLDKYGLPDPILGEGGLTNPEGVFTDPHLQDLYDQLTTDGSQSLLAALKVGGFIEEVDIDDLVIAMAATEKADLSRVYGNLMSGSENHLRAFAGLIESRTGLPYEAVYLEQDEVDAILEAS